MSNNNTKKLESESNNHACGEPCEIWSRPCGYYRPTKNWNLGKQSEFQDRITFEVKPNTCQCCNKKNG